MSRDDYTPEAKAELAKPTVSIERVGTDADAAREWEAAAFKQARRANGLNEKLRKIRDEIDAALAEDDASRDN